MNAPSRIEDRALASDYETNKVDLRLASSFTPKPIRWLWRHYLARGKLHVLAGSPGTGKTTLALSLAATLSTGRDWPDHTISPLGNVLIWSGEDDPSDVLVPRLLASGADLNRVFIVGDTHGSDGDRAFDPGYDMALLEAEAKKIGNIALVIADPIVNAVLGDSHKNTEVRRGLQPLVDLASRLDAAVLGISHFSKGTSGREPTERVTGSIAFGAVARVVLVTAKQENGSHLVARAKSNIGPTGGGYSYELVVGDHDGIEVSHVQWGNVIEGTARELLGDAEAVGDSIRADAGDWLTKILETAPVAVTKIKDEAKSAGLSWRTVENAKKDIGAVAERQSSGNDGAGFWTWRLPGATPQATRPHASSLRSAVLPERRRGAGFESTNAARPQGRRETAEGFEV
jgi:hypothetical protein